jgi:holliday junction DNA helicase RuvA
MIVRLTGSVIEVTEDSAVIDRDGIARAIQVPGYALGELTACRGRQVTLHTLEYIEGGHGVGNLIPRLIGFLHAEDRDFFVLFTTVKNVGTRKALKALTEPVRKVATWIEAGDTRALAQLPGIGKRAAEMIVAELKGKLTAFAVGEATTAPTADAARFTEDQQIALQLLLDWGDGRQEAEHWLHRAAQLYPDLESPEDWVRVAYRVKTGMEG